MSVKEILPAAKKAIRNTKDIARLGFGTILKDPSIIGYVWFAGLFIAISYPLISALVLPLWHHVAPGSFDMVNQGVPHRLRFALGLVTFYYFYITVVTAYFICAVSAATEAKLNDHPTGVLHGLRVVLGRFSRITHFALLAIFFVPIGIFSQRKKLPKGIFEVFTSSLSLHTANLAPAILNEKKGVVATIHDSVNTLGVVWKENLVIKITTYLTLAILLPLAGFLPEWAQRHWFDQSTTHWVVWLTRSLLGAGIFILAKVLGAVFTTILYHRVHENPQAYK